MTKIIFLCACIVLYKLVRNVISLLKIHYYKKQYIDFLARRENHIEQYAIQTVQLFKQAGIKDASIPISQPIGFGQVANFNASIFANFPSNKLAFASSSLDMFENAIGVFRARIIECFNPIYWIEQIIFLPKHILLYIGLNSENVAFKISNVLLTFIWWLLGVSFSIFRTDFLNYIIKLLGSLK